MNSAQWAAFVFIILMMVIIVLTGNKPDEDEETYLKHKRLMKEIRDHEDLSD